MSLAAREAATPGPRRCLQKAEAEASCVARGNLCCWVLMSGWRKPLWTYRTAWPHWVHTGRICHRWLRERLAWALKLMDKLGQGPQPTTRRSVWHASMDLASVKPPMSWQLKIFSSSMDKEGSASMDLVRWMGRAKVALSRDLNRFGTRKPNRTRPSQGDWSDSRFHIQNGTTRTGSADRQRVLNSFYFLFRSKP